MGHRELDSFDQTWPNSNVKRAANRQLPLPLRRRFGWGGARSGAGRPPGRASPRAAPRAPWRTRLGARPRHRESALWPSVAPPGRLRPGVPGHSPTGLRAGRLPGSALLRPDRPRASTRRVGREARARLRDEIHRRAYRARDPSRLCARGTRARRPLSPPRLADAARGPERHRLRPAQRPSSLREARWKALAASPRRRVVRALVRRLGRAEHTSLELLRRRARSRTTAHMARPCRLAPPRPDRPWGARPALSDAVEGTAAPRPLDRSGTPHRERARRRLELSASSQLAAWSFTRSFASFPLRRTPTSTVSPIS